MLAVWPVLCTLGIYESDEANHNYIVGYRGLHDSIDGRVNRPSELRMQHLKQFS